MSFLKQVAIAAICGECGGKFSPNSFCDECSGYYCETVLGPTGLYTHRQWNDICVNCCTCNVGPPNNALATELLPVDNTDHSKPEK